MDIAAMSTTMAMQSLQNAISTTMLAKTMNQDAISVDKLLEGMANANQSPQAPSFGHRLDTRA